MNTFHLKQQERSINKHGVTFTEAMLNSVKNNLGDKLKNLSPNIKRILASKSFSMFTKTKQAVTTHDQEVFSKSLFWVSFISLNIHTNLKKNYSTIMIWKK